ncbi:hypothetical protein OEZ85_005794 [Tetradesmus obliquus]|uniref:GB1/RHD3-type G domain-containing protein n=1 Tax=Tetradesmus obliquus TaxID=3088 RepID=A0ABY8UFR5_TETOB|nr:hypothetical protein OEZ85_005794 [Tetradesmus obliquus]
MIAVIVIWTCWLASVQSFEAKPYALVNPVAGTSHLKVADEGIALLNSIEGPVAPVVVIGPYRSGKSFLLNQLLGVPCYVGFGVGHTRETETKGIWVWGQPQSAEDGSKTLLYIDTEGFESTGRSNSYDDRVFAVATVMSSLLIYNLPETIRGSDVSKLSFVVELAAGFYDQTNKSSVAVPVEPGSMLWVIQRDFLQGKSVQQLVKDALAPVPNPQQDKAITETNNIRASLASIARNSTGFSLPQPHLDRTKLCELNDSQLEPSYVSQRDALKRLVLQQAAQKVVGGEALTGKRLAALLQSLIAALNAKEIPTGAGLIDSFNREAVSKALAAFTEALDQAVQLPVDESVLDQAENRARDEALGVFKEQLLGRRQAEALTAQLEAAITKEAKAKRTANVAESNVVCQAHEMACSKLLASMARGLQIPSMRQFEGRYKACLATFEAKCVGPARSSSAERLQLAWSQARSQFGKDYNDRLFTGLLVAAVAAIVIFRFVIKVALLEAAGWLAVVFLELYPHLLGGAGSMYDTAWWKITASVWEALVLLLFGAGGLLLWVACGAAALLGWRRVRRRQQHKKAVLTSRLGDIRDLDV